MQIIKIFKGENDHVQEAIQAKLDDGYKIVQITSTSVADWNYTVAVVFEKEIPYSHRPHRY